MTIRIYFSTYYYKIKLIDELSGGVSKNIIRMLGKTGDIAWGENATQGGKLIYDVISRPVFD